MDFTENLRRKTTAELKEYLREDGYKPEAIKSAINILRERGVNVDEDVRAYQLKSCSICKLRAFDASRSSLSFDTDWDYEYVSVTNNSNQDVYVSTDKEWLSASMSGSSVKISCSSNSDSPRRGTVTLSCGNKQYSISVKQKGWVNCSSCGGKGYVSRIGYRQDFMGYTPMGQPIYGPPYPVTENVTCAACKNSDIKGKVKRSY